ncbi:hypothetical protein FCH28_09655 [Streptomyces piniterrae]|uniref:Uncharacterized protein n=1 Tax=Streptomyces piniterrae TaxID=2571125 RepID=A0A4U0NMG4_9ACTN|nr:hypothetical protein [Streptomyces piniterrae]TJZ55596.1 hypothetical protein FCH28_09655 [Streptomyces piniterrae]
MKVFERTENGVTSTVSKREGLDEINHAQMGGKRDVRTMSSITRTDFAIEYKDGRKVRLVLVDAPERTSPRFAFGDLVMTDQGLGKVAKVISVPRRNGTRITRYDVELDTGGEIYAHESDVRPFEPEMKSPEQPAEERTALIQRRADGHDLMGRVVTVKGKDYVVSRIVPADRPVHTGAPKGWEPRAYVDYWSERDGMRFGATRTAGPDAKPGTVGRAIWDAVNR